ncbi:MAG: hypothetical protein AAGH64_09715, partial [Planctomycetota bacterium]
MIRRLACAALCALVPAVAAHAQITIRIDPVAETIALDGFDQGTGSPFRGQRGGPSQDFLLWQSVGEFGDTTETIQFEEGTDFTLEPSGSFPPELLLFIDDTGLLILEGLVDAQGSMIDFTGFNNPLSYADLPQEFKNVLAQSDGVTLFPDFGTNFDSIDVVVGGENFPDPPDAYDASITIQAGTRTEVDGTSVRLTCFPFIEARDEGSPFRGVATPTDAFITLSTPNGFSRGFVNNPESISGSSTFYDDQNALLSELNGTWTLRVDEPNGQAFEYELAITFALPFAQAPRIASSSIVDGAPYAPPFDFQILGGDAQQIGPDAFLRGRLEVDEAAIDTFTVLQGDSPFTPPGFTPDGTETSFNLLLSTTSEIADTRSATLVSVTPITPGAPGLTVSSLRTRYAASIRADLGPVPVTLCAGDFDGDLDVDLGDFGVFGAAFNSTTGDANYDPRADFDND